MHDTSDALAVRFLIYGRLVSEAVCTFAALRLPDLIGESGCRVPKLADRAGLMPGPLEDLLRLMAVCGLVHVEDGWVRITPRGRYLRGDRPGSALPTALLVRDSVGKAWDGLETTLRTGRPAFDRLYGRTFFEQIDRDPRLRSVFDDSQARGLELELDVLAGPIAASGRTRIIDIGGGDGFLVARLLDRFPAVTGIVLDRESAVERARSRMIAQGYAERCECVVGDFLAPFAFRFEAGDLLIMRHICHDWDDPTCITILANCRDAMTEGARLVVVEHFGDHSAGEMDPMAAIMSLYMATVTSGRERTIAEYEKLHTAAGLTVIGVTRAGGACVIESVNSGQEPTRSGSSA